MSKEKAAIPWLARLLQAYVRRPMIVRLRRCFGSQPNDRDEAEAFAERRILPALEHGREIILDFRDTSLVTQSFIHALISEAVKGDARYASRIKTANASKAQEAVVDLAVRHMISPVTNKVRSGQSLQPN